MVDVEKGPEERMSFWTALNSGCGNAIDRKNQVRFLGWCIGWLMVLASTVYFLENNPDFQGPAAWAIALIPFALSMGIVFSYLRFLRNADEFIRKIQIEGLAFGFGVGIVVGIAYQLLERVGAPEMSTNDLVMVMAVGWMLGQLTGVWRYR